MTTLTTPLCRQLGIEVPVVQAPIGSAVTTELVAAVAEAGGLGTLALTWVTAEEAVRRIREVRRMTPRPFAVNLVLDFPVDELLDACLAEGVPALSTFWGDPRPSPNAHTRPAPFTSTRSVPSRRRNAPLPRAST